jgi:sec-independent protein translocase protein TatC
METKKAFYEHIEDFRKLVLKAIIAISIFSVLAYFFKEEILTFLNGPMEKSLVFLSPTEPIISLIKLSIFTGTLVAAPYILSLIWNFISVALEKKNKKKVTKYLFFSIFLFYGAIIFCYFVVLPIVINFLVNFENPVLTSSISLENYLNFAMYLLISFGIIFQFPLVLLVLINLDIISVETLKTKRVYFVLTIFIIAAILTPPDVISQMLLALPMILLFELTLIFAKLKK